MATLNPILRNKEGRSANFAELEPELESFGYNF